MGKMKRWQKIICMGLAMAVVVSGFMGIEKFQPKERTLKIINDEAITTGADTTSAEQDGSDHIEEVDLDIDAKAAVLMDGNSGEVLYAQNEKKHLPPASVTKVMTLLLILEGCESGKISFDDEVVISERAAQMGGSQMYMEMGETHTVEELLKGVIMVSANDGCVALAEHLSGSVESFVNDMNNRAKELGLEDSNFVNTNGLPVANHYSCAYDIGKISVELMKHEKAHKWFTAWQEDIKVGLPGKQSKFTLTNTNKLIKTYNGAIGVKTGYTDDAGYCLSGAAERDESRFIAVVLGCKTSNIRFAEVRRLLDHGFANYEAVKIAKAGKKIKRIDIKRGSCDKIYAVTDESITITVKKGSSDKIVKKVSIKDSITPPIKKGDTVGKLTVYEGEETKYTYDLVADRNVSKVSIIKYYIRKIREKI